MARGSNRSPFMKKVVSFKSHFKILLMMKLGSPDAYLIRKKKLSLFWSRIGLYLVQKLSILVSFKRLFLVSIIIASPGWVKFLRKCTVFTLRMSFQGYCRQECKLQIIILDCRFSLFLDVNCSLNHFDLLTNCVDVVF